MYETAIGADMGAMTEAEHYVKEVATGEVPFLLTSCCPSWSMLAKKFFPETIDKISNALTPMVATARGHQGETPRRQCGIYRHLCQQEARGKPQDYPLRCGLCDHF